MISMTEQKMEFDSYTWKLDNHYIMIHNLKDQPVERKWKVNAMSII